YLKSAGREHPIDARAYVLALEDMVDGALRAGVHTVVDPFFHQSLAHHAVPTERTDESLFKPQPFASIGYAVTDRLEPSADDGHLPRPEVPRSRIRTLPVTAGGRGHGRARSLLRLQALRGHLPVAGLDPGIHPASTKQRRRGEGPDAPRLGPGTHAPAQPVWK